MSLKSDQTLMEQAWKQAHRHKTPFGAIALMDDGSVITAANTSRITGDPTAHAEMEVLRKYNDLNTSAKINTLYTTCEPCCMCMGALIWCGVKRLAFGVTIETASRYLNQIMVSSQTINQHSFYSLEIKGHILDSECEELFKTYSH